MAERTEEMNRKKTRKPLRTAAGLLAFVLLAARFADVPAQAEEETVSADEPETGEMLPDPADEPEEEEDSIYSFEIIPDEGYSGDGYYYGKTVLRWLTKAEEPLQADRLVFSVAKDGGENRVYSAEELLSKTPEEMDETGLEKAEISEDRSQVTLVFGGAPEHDGAYEVSAVYMTEDMGGEDRLTLRFAIDTEGPKPALAADAAPASPSGIYGSGDSFAFTVSAGKECGIAPIQELPVSIYNPADGRTEELMRESFLKEEGMFSVNRRIEPDKAGFNGDGIVLTASAADYAGNTGFAQITVSLDTSAPSGSLAFDKSGAENGIYFRTGKTLYLEYTDSHFDPSSEISVSSSTGAGYESTGWYRTGAGWAAAVHFVSDGVYSLTVTGKDLAGNVSHPISSGSFVIDTTPPAVHIGFEDVPGANVLFFNSSRCAVITVSEANFSPDLTDIIFPEGEAPVVSDWAFSGGAYIRKVLFEKDGAYDLKVSCTDMAGNMSEPVQTDSFIIDTAPPLVEFFPPGEGGDFHSLASALARIRDRYLVGYSAAVGLTDVNGESVDISGLVSVETDGGEAFFPLTGLDGLPDARYILTASASDMAGNTGIGSFDFTLNRQGSAFVLQDPEAFSGTFLNRLPEEIVITERNLSPLQVREISYSVNGTVHVLEEGTDYIETITDEDGYITVTSRIDTALFSRDGRYSVNVVSVDAAGNVSGSVISAPVRFTYDTVPPSVSVSGMSGGAEVKADYAEFCLQLSDSSGVARLTVEEEGKGKKVYLKGDGAFVNAGNPAESLLCENGRIHFVLFSEAARRSFVFTAEDAAGNTASFSLPDILVYRGNAQNVPSEEKTEEKQEETAASGPALMPEEETAHETGMQTQDTPSGRNEQAEKAPARPNLPAEGPAVNHAGPAKFLLFIPAAAAAAAVVILKKNKKRKNSKDY